MRLRGPQPRGGPPITGSPPAPTAAPAQHPRRLHLDDEQQQAHRLRPGALQGPALLHRGRGAGQGLRQGQDAIPQGAGSGQAEGGAAGWGAWGPGSACLPLGAAAPHLARAGQGGALKSRCSEKEELEREKQGGPRHPAAVLPTPPGPQPRGLAVGGPPPAPLPLPHLVGPGG